jgi:hypothetical protein
MAPACRGESALCQYGLKHRSMLSFDRTSVRRIASGIVNPSVLAVVLRLATSLKCVGCSTGMSAGLAT